ncbi:MAG: PAS domain-containing sensor histidine kinase, partial [Deltaproteobacteria bacterium]
MKPEPKGRPEAVDPRERRRRIREGLIIFATGIAVLVFALWEIRRPGAHAGAAGNVFSFLLVNLNIILLLLLVFLVTRNIAKLVIERRRRVPGSHLRNRMVLAFVAIALFPALVMLLVSLEFMTNTIDSWFNREVDSALRGAWQVAQV